MTRAIIKLGHFIKKNVLLFHYRADIIHPMFRRLFCLVLVFLASNVDSPAGDKPPVKSPVSDTTGSSRAVILNAFKLPAPANSDTASFAPGDSLFLFDGEPYFRARAKGSDFFVSKSEILKYSDSLVIFQYLRITPAIQSGALGDSSSKKIERRRCNAINKNGSRCKRQALPGLDKCWQHKK